MATELKLRRGTTSQHSSFTGAEAEVTVDTDKETVVVHNGATAGGYPVAREDLSNVNISAGDLPSEAYQKNNILGTVSESGGVPTGAIIERGSNSNGEFVKYADGTLICTAESTGEQTRQFPATFISKSKVVATALCCDSTPFYVHDGLANLTSNYYITESSNKSIIAIGRWY